MQSSLLCFLDFLWLLNRVKFQVITTSLSLVFLCHFDLLLAFVSSLSKVPHVNYAQFQHESTMASRIRLWTFYYVYGWIFPYPKHVFIQQRFIMQCHIVLMFIGTYWKFFLLMLKFKFSDARCWQCCCSRLFEHLLHEYRGSLCCICMCLRFLEGRT